jgi:hypothetical protein
MKTIKLNIHSFVDLITNSSTTIYVQVHDKTIGLVEELINYFLKQGGSKKTASDLFEFKLKRSLDWEENKIWDIADELDCNSEEAKKVFQQRRKKGEYDGEDEAEDRSESGLDKRRLVLIPKTGDKEVIDLTKKIEEIFSIDGDYDG